MLFSRPEVAAYIDRNFEAAWESIRPVPMVRIDFGNGHALTRTLHGNIATYVCTAEGDVLDILPGIYSPGTFVDRLYQFRLLANYVDQLGPGHRAERSAAYHRDQARALRERRPPQVFTNMDMSKMAVEGRMKAVLIAGRPSPEQPSNPAAEAPQDPSTWKSLVEDTRLNETERRLQIHDMLAKESLVGPKELTRPLYKNVLHTDLDDPYLGLGEVLFAGYPFKDGDPRRAH